MGFDNECILSIQSLAGEYFCPVCRLLVYPSEALQSECTHLYCKPCLTYIANSSRACPYDGYLVTEADSKPLIKSNKALAETINKIAVHCLYHRSGCTWQGPLSECISHCSGCAFGNSPVVCNRCGIQIVHRQVQEHAQNCPGVQPQATLAVPSHEATAASAAAVNPSQISQPAGPASSQAQTSETVNVAAVPTPEQWYQQQYHQYYQQYAGHAACNPQFQQGYPLQQQQEAVQPQHYQQSEPQLQSTAPPQSQQGPVSSQPKQQPAPPHPQAQPQPQPHGQLQVPPQAQSQAPPVPVPPPNNQQQLQPTVLPYPQLTQTHPPQSLQLNTPHSHLLPYPQQHPTQTLMQQHQPPAHHPQAHAHPLPHSQAEPHGPSSHPLAPPHSQPNQPANALPQMQVSAHAVPGYQSYSTPQPPSQLQLGGPQQHPLPIRPPQQSQQPVQVQGQGLFPQPSLPVRPPQSQVSVLNQQNPGLLLPRPHSTNFPPAQPPSIYPHTQQTGQLVSPHTVVQPIHQNVPQQYAQQQQPPFVGQQLALSQNQLYQQGSFAQQQMLARPLGSTPSHPTQPPQNVAVSHTLRYPHPFQNPVGRPPMPNYGVPLQVSPRAPATVQVRPMQPGFNPNNMAGPKTGQSSLQEQPRSAFHPTMLERSVTNNQADGSSERTAKMDEEPLAGNANEMEMVKTETEAKRPPVNHEASDYQELPKKQMAKEESAECKVELSDVKSGQDSLTSSGTGQSQLQQQQQVTSHHIPHEQGYLQRRMPLGEPLERTHPDALDNSGGMFISEKQDRNAMEAEKFPDRRPFHNGTRQPNPNLPRGLQQGSAAHTERRNGPPGVDSSSFIGHEERFKSLPDEHMHASSVNLSRHAYDRRGFEEELKSFRNPLASQFLSGGRFDVGPFEKAVHGLTPDGVGTASSRMLPPYDRDVVSGKRTFGRPEDNVERFDLSRIHTDVLGSAPGYHRRYMEASVNRSPGRDYCGLPSHGPRSLPGISHGLSGPDDLLRREIHLHGDPVSSSFLETRLQGFPGHFQRGKFEGPGNLGIGEHLRNGGVMGRDLPRHELLGPRNMRVGEAGGFSSFHDQSSISLQGHSADGYRAKESFNDLRSRRITNMGWCRICKFGCETVEGLDLHSQTMEHQKMAMDIVRSIKQQNSKKQKLSSSDKSSVEDPSRSRTPNSEVRGRKH